MSLDTPNKHSVVPGNPSIGLKRKRLQLYLSSPPLELDELQEQEQAQHLSRQERHQEQATQTDLDLIYSAPKGLTPSVDWSRPVAVQDTCDRCVRYGQGQDCSVEIL